MGEWPEEDWVTLRLMSLNGAAPVIAKSMPGICSTLAAPGENPLLRFHSAGSTGTPPAFFGIACALKFTCKPVSVALLARVKKLLGKGSKQARWSSRSQISTLDALDYSWGLPAAGLCQPPAGPMVSVVRGPQLPGS